MGRSLCLAVPLLPGLLSDAAAQTQAQRAYLEMAATVYTAYVTCPGGLSPDPTETVAALGLAQDIDPADVAPSGRYHALFQSIVLRLAADMKGKAAPEACAMLAARYPKLIPLRTR